VLVACSRGSGEEPPTPETSEAATTFTSPTTLVPATSTTLGFERPATIDVPYVQRVVDEIYRLEGEAARYIYAKKVPDAEFNARLEAIFGEPELEEAKSLYGRIAASGFETFANPPGNPSVKVVSILDTTSTCILARADLDFRPLFIGSDRTDIGGILELSPADVLPHNPTSWGVVAAGKPVAGQDLSSC
jgi:hypothetical protein